MKILLGAIVAIGVGLMIILNCQTTTEVEIAKRLKTDDFGKSDRLATICNITKGKCEGMWDEVRETRRIDRNMFIYRFCGQASKCLECPPPENCICDKNQSNCVCPDAKNCTIIVNKNDGKSLCDPGAFNSCKDSLNLK